MITGQDQNIFRSVGVNKIDVLGNRICSPPIYIQIVDIKYIVSVFSFE